MPASLFCVDILGKIHRLSTSSSQWEPLPYLGVEFKRLSASESSLWAIGSDQQVYVFIYGMENPIRVKEETYENQVTMFNSLKYPGNLQKCTIRNVADVSVFVSNL